MPIIWNPYLVVLSILVAIFGSFTALVHAKRMRESTGSGTNVWMMMGGITLGLVIWAMHFIGMLAFHLSIPVSYAPLLTLLSVLPAVAAALLGFYLLRTKEMHFGRIAGGSLVMGLGISAMHYTGMEALEMSPPIIYDPVIVSTSVGIAVLAAYAALLIVYAGEKLQLPPLVYHGLGGVVMGLAISGMHYTAMTGTYFPLGSVCLGDSFQIDPALLPLFVSISLFFLLGLGTLANLFEQRITRQKDQGQLLQMLQRDMEERARTMALDITEELRSRQHALSAISQGVLITDAQRRVTYVNDAFEQITGYAKSELIGGNCGALLQGTGTNPATVAELGTTLHADRPFQGEILNYRKDGTPFWNELSITPIHDSEGRLTQFVGVQRDITESKHSRQREYMRNEVLEQLAKGAPLPDILEALVRSVEASHFATFCSMLLLDEEGRHLLLGAAPSLPEDYNRAIDGVAIGPSAGSCGTAAFRRERVIVSDIGSDSLWADYRELALSYGLQACWSQPILSSTDQVLGTFAMYYKEIHTPNDQELTTIRDAANIACIAIEHVRTQQALHIAATTFETQEGIIITDSNKIILRINRAFTRIYGYSFEEVTGTTPSLLQSGYHDDEFYNAMWETLQRDNYWAGEVCDQRKNGEVFPAWLTITAVTEDDCITHYVGTFSDITNYKHTQEELQKHRDHLQELVEQQTANLRDSTARIYAILNTVAEGIITIDERGIVETFNPAAENIFGYTAAEMAGSNVNMLMSEPYHSQFEGYLEHYRSTGEMRIMGIRREVMGQRKDGSAFPLEMAISKMQLEEGCFFTGIVRDITERRQAEDQLDRFFALSLDLMCIVSMDGYFKRINPAFTKTLGWSAEELMARPFLEFVHPDDRVATFRQVEKLVVNEIVMKNYENRYLHKDGSWRTLSWTAVAYSDGLRFANARDITDNKRIDEKLRAQSKEIMCKNQELERASRMKSEFIATMSHEIRTPINGVIGMIDLLHQSSLKDYQVEMVELIRESAYSLLDIIEDILDFSKIEAGKLELESAPMPVSSIVEKACAMLDHLATKKSVELTLFTDPAIPAEVLGDAVRLRQILINLANNAIKFSSGQDQAGRVSVRAVLAERGPDRVVVEIHIADNGIGMDEKTLSKLFSPFTQADATTTRRFGGTGLGLTISQHLAELMGGEIAVQSVPGKGSSFTLRLPFVPLPARADVGQAESPVTGLSCLLIGNSPWLVGDIATYLTDGGATIQRVPDLTAAREQAGAGSPALWIWILDKENMQLSPDELRAIAHSRPEQKNRFVVFERGQRRKPRLEDDDIVRVDANMLTRGVALKAVAIAAGRLQQEQETLLPARIRTDFNPPARADALRQGRLILVAEDNETNQKVILRQLALLGFAADVVGDGREALNRWHNGAYALLITDLNMPIMDGYELAKAIRAGEIDSRLPILALTANALKGEAEHCRAAGMDGYLTKPVRLEQLKTLLEQWLPGVDAAPPSADVINTSSKQHTSIPKPLDESVLEELVGDDPEVINEFLRDFRSSATRIAAEMKTAYASRQAAQVGALAHKLKSSARSVGALELGELCAAIEQAGKAGQIDVLASLLSRFEVEMAAVAGYLEALSVPGES